MSYISRRVYEFHVEQLDQDLERGDINVKTYTRLMNDLDADYYGDDGIADEW